MEFTHFDEKGASRMVDVSGKAPTKREATATGKRVMYLKWQELLLLWQ